VSRNLAGVGVGVRIRAGCGAIERTSGQAELRVLHLRSRICSRYFGRDLDSTQRG
jgi:hypothetical protein